MYHSGNFSFCCCCCCCDRCIRIFQYIIRPFQVSRQFLNKKSNVPCRSPRNHDLTSLIACIHMGSRKYSVLQLLCQTKSARKLVLSEILVNKISVVKPINMHCARLTASHKIASVSGSL